MKKFTPPKIFIILLALAFSGKSTGQHQGTDSLAVSLHEAIQYALKNNLEIKDNRLNTEQRRLDYHQSRAAVLPSLNAISAFNFNLGRSINPVTNEFTSNPVNSQDYGIQSQVVIFDGLRTIHQINAAKAALEGEQYTWKAIKRDVTLQVINAYLQVLLNQELMLGADQAQKATEDRIARTQSLVNAGEVAEFEILQLQSQLADEQVTYTNSYAEYINAEMQLRQILLVPESTKIKTSTPSRYVNGLPETSITIDKNENNLSLAQTQSRIHNPALASAEMQIKFREHELAAARSGYLPTISAQAGMFTSYSNDPPPFLEENSFSSQLDFNLRRFVGLELNIPIFNNLRNRLDVARAKIEIERSELNKHSVLNEHNQQIERIYQDMIAADEIYTSAESRLKTKTKAYEQLLTRFELGEANILDLTQAKAELVQAESFHTQAKYRMLFFQKVWHYVLTNEVVDY